MKIKYVIILVVLCIINTISFTTLIIHNKVRKDIKELEPIIIERLEYKYFKGQIDCLNGDIIVYYDEEDSCWCWVDDISDTLFDPSLTKGKRNKIKEFKFIYK